MSFHSEDKQRLLDSILRLSSAQEPLPLLNAIRAARWLAHGESKSLSVSMPEIVKVPVSTLYSVKLPHGTLMLTPAMLLCDGDGTVFMTAYYAPLFGRIIESGGIDRTLIDSMRAIGMRPMRVDYSHD